MIYVWTLVFQLHMGRAIQPDHITVVPDFATESACQAAAEEIKLQRGNDVWWVCFRVRK